MDERCVWVSLPHATFGLVIRDGRVTEAPPIARWAVGRDERDIAAHFRRRGATFRDIPRPAGHNCRFEYCTAPTGLCDTPE